MTMTATCPNCESPVAPDAAACPKCRADFGKNSAWRPVGPGNRAAPGRGGSLSNASSALAVGATVVAAAAWLVVLLGAMSRSLEQTGDFQMFRWALSRSLAGPGPSMALFALLLAAVAVAFSKGRKVPTVALLLGGTLWLFALFGAR